MLRAGEAKAGVVPTPSKAKSIRIPGSAPRAPNARFYVTLEPQKARRRQVSLVPSRPITDEQLERAVIDLATAGNKRISI